MNVDNFYKYIKQPESLKADNIAEIQSVLDSYPYFQPAHFLYLKALYQQNNFRFNEQLKKSSVFISNRKKLLYFLKEEYSYFNQNKKDLDTTLAGNNLKDKESLSFADIFSLIKIADSSNYLADNNWSVLEASDKKLTFSEWVEQLHNIFKEKQKTTVKKVEDKSVTEERIKKIAIKDPQQNSIIDRFLDNTESKIIKAKQEQENTIIDIQEENDMGFVTETLAKIYVSQAYYDKAIESYKKLSLKYPKKNSYFASQIEKIEQQKQNL